MRELVIIKGAGDIATGIGHRLFRCGFRVVMTELPQPTVIRRTVAFAEAVFAGRTEVEGVTAVRVELSEALRVVNEGLVAVLVDPEARAAAVLQPWALVDAILAKRNINTRLDDAPIVVAVGPGFTAGVDAHAVVETMRGHYLGKVITTGPALPNTGSPGEIGGHTDDRLLRAPCAGLFTAVRKIADTVAAGDVVAHVDGRPVTAAIDGVLRGMLHDGLPVTAGMKIGDIDPRAKREHCFSISDKASAVGGGVLEALLYTAGLRSPAANTEIGACP